MPWTVVTLLQVRNHPLSESRVEAAHVRLGSITVVEDRSVQFLLRLTAEDTTISGSLFACASRISCLVSRFRVWSEGHGRKFHCYFTPYKSDIDAALQVLREAEFKAGRYSAAMMAAEPPLYMFQMEFPPEASSPILVRSIRALKRRSRI